MIFLDKNRKNVYFTPENYLLAKANYFVRSLSMKMTKSIVASFVALTMGISGAFAQEFSFSNEVSSDLVTITKADDTEKDFAGISEKAEFEFKSEKVDAGVMVEFTVDDYGADEGYGFKWTDYNYYIEFRPIHEITLAWHDDIYTTASYLPVWDDNVSTGNFGSDGFTVVTRPYPGLRISATIPFQFENDGPNTINFLNGDSDSGEDDFNFGFGFDYTLGNLFSVGFTMIDAVDSDERSYGVFASIMPKNNEDFIISAGFSGSESSVDVEELDFTDELSISATKLYQVACVYNYDALSLAAEIVGSIDKEENFYDLYTGVKAGYAIDDALSVSLTGKLFFDLGNEDGIDEAETVMGFSPEVEYVYGAHTFSFGVAFQVCDGDTFVKFPVSWKYDL